MDQEPGKVTRNAVSAGEMSDPGASSGSVDEIRSQIEQTRAEMSDTIDAIQARLSPGRLVSDATEKVKDATVGFIPRRALDAVQANPVPSLLFGALTTAIAIGAWFESRSGSSRLQPQSSSSSGGQRALMAVAITGLACLGAMAAQRSRGRQDLTGIPSDDPTSEHVR